MRPFPQVTPGSNRGRHGPFALAFALSASAHVAILALCVAFVAGGPATAPASTLVRIELVRGTAPSRDETRRDTPGESVPATATDRRDARAAAPRAPATSAPAPDVASRETSDAIAAPSAEPTQAEMPISSSPGVAAATRTDAPNAPNALALQVQSQLERFKLYPRAARRERIEGTALLRFSIDREGRLLERALVTSSGHAVLDRAALELLARAAPYPALPPDATLERIELTLPVDYRLVAALDRG